MLTIPMCKITVQHLLLKEVVGMLCGECVCICAYVLSYLGDCGRIINTARFVPIFLRHRP